MAGLTVLDNNIVQDLLRLKFDDNDILIDVPVYTTQPALPAIINHDNKTIIIIAPILADKYFSVLTEIDEYRKDSDAANYHVIIPIQGNGITERHIITAHCRPSIEKNPENFYQNRITFYDPKAGDAHKFFNGPHGIKPKTLLAGLLRSLWPKPHNQIVFDNQSQTKGNYVALGTQSFFDGVSCGYHSAATILAMDALLTEEKTITRSAILSKMGDPVKDRLPNIAHKMADIHFSSFIKKAWADTYLTGTGQDENTSFDDYFIGKLKDRRLTAKIFHYISLGFVATPLLNAIKIFTEFMPNALSETGNYLKNQLITWAPKNVFSQYLRSGLMLAANGMQFLFKGIYLALRAVTSPIVSYKAANERHPVLGVISLGISSFGLVLFAFASIPILLALNVKEGHRLFDTGATDSDSKKQEIKQSAEEVTESPVRIFQAINSKKTSFKIKRQSDVIAPDKKYLESDIEESDLESVILESENSEHESDTESLNGFTCV